ncbi:hypothetical protein HHI36_023145 [Cryptolaemus montrouzieri]|uniref:Reverse transcriptase domain-containing protein n=1 Tax=Cryptolaemus montrouzieri TaxID=559131 RepID=A0ABD2PFX2_9CUCU
MDLGEVIASESLHQFADDTQLLATFGEGEFERGIYELKLALQRVYDYSGDHGVRINPNKTQAICFGRVEPCGLDELMVNSTRVSYSKTVKNLDLIISNDLRFREHVASLTQRCYMSRRMLYKNRDILSLDLKKQLCLVLSHTNYGDVLYGPCMDVITANRIQKIQNSCVRFIFSLNIRDHITSRLAQLNWIRMNKRTELHFAVFLHKIIRTITVYKR